MRILQEKEFERVGGHRTLKTDVRIIAATNKNLERAVEEETFRGDLYYRLNVFPIYMPPLRARKTDILLLADYFLEKYAVQNDKTARLLSPDAEAGLLRHPWTGNVRELQNRILQAVLMSDSEEIDSSGLALEAAENKLPGPAHLECLVSKIAVIETGDGKHAHQIHDDGCPHGDRTPADPDNSQASCVQQHKRHNPEPIHRL
mgnify:CR=1 FL=1